MGAMSTPPASTADRSVRVAWTADADAIGAVQARAWSASYAEVLPAAALAELDPGAVASRWAEALRRPPSARHRVIVALERNDVVGFAAVAPSDDPDADLVADAELVVLAVHPDHTGAGHGSRLLAAVVDTCRSDGFTRLTAWLLGQDDAQRRFLESAGWAPDGAHREMVADDAAPPLRQVRLHTSLEEE
jgi:GNAT superfamily N-acetyltransferase